MDQSTEQEILSTGIKVIDLIEPYPKGGKIGARRALPGCSALGARGAGVGACPSQPRARGRRRAVWAHPSALAQAFSAARASARPS